MSMKTFLEMRAMRAMMRLPPQSQIILNDIFHSDVEDENRNSHYLFAPLYDVVGCNSSSLCIFLSWAFHHFSPEVHMILPTISMMTALRKPFYTIAAAFLHGRTFINKFLLWLPYYLSWVIRGGEFHNSGRPSPTNMYVTYILKSDPQP